MLKKKLIPNKNWIIKDPNIILRTQSTKIDLPLKLNEEVVINKMISYVDACYYNKHQKYSIKPGIAIAAPQLGVNKSIIYINFGETINNKYINHKYLLINPEIVKFSDELIALKNGEGCLSIDKTYCGYVYRNKNIVVKFYDWFQKKENIVNASGILSICIQHEIDHLNGILFYDLINHEFPFEVKPNSSFY